MTDKKFTDEEIIKALMCHFNEELDEEPFQCVDCPLYNDTSPSCTEALKSYVLDLINRQKETIETLRKCVEQHHIIRKDSKSPLSLLTEEIRAEAYKEFAERLKKETLSDRGYDILQQGTIDNLLKEMVGEEE